jgi:hypothetical protein
MNVERKQELIKEEQSEVGVDGRREIRFGE